MLLFSAYTVKIFNMYHTHAYHLKNDDRRRHTNDDVQQSFKPFMPENTYSGHLYTVYGQHTGAYCTVAHMTGFKVQLLIDVSYFYKK